MKKNKLMRLILSFFVVASLFGGMLTTVTQAAEGTVDVTINKRHNMNNDGATTPNTGEEMEDFGGEPLAGAEFTAYDVTDLFHTYMESSDEATAIAKIQADYSPLAPEDAIAVGTALETDADGKAVFRGLQVREDEAPNRYKVYVFVETKTPLSPSVIEKSVPLVLAMPIYKLAEDGSYTDTINRDIYLYPKNVTAEDIKVFDNTGEFDFVEVNGEKHFNIKTGDVLDFTVSLNVPIDIAEKSEYSLSDTPTEGLAYTDGTLNITGLAEGEDYTLTLDDKGGFKLTFNLESDKVLALAGRVLEVKYKMTLTAEVTPEDLYQNNASVSVDNNSRPDMETPDKPQFYTNGHKFVKRDAQTGKELEGAEFVLGNGLGQFAELSVNSKGEYVFVAWTTKDLASRLVSNADGEFHVIGLTKGAYILNETKAPSDKYVAISGDIDFVVDTGYATSELQAILNHPKGLLPSTGGNGIYAYLAIGSILMLGSFLWFRRSTKEMPNA